MAMMADNDTYLICIISQCNPGNVLLLTDDVKNTNSPVLFYFLVKNHFF